MFPWFKNTQVQYFQENWRKQKLLKEYKSIHSEVEKTAFYENEQVTKEELDKWGRTENEKVIFSWLGFIYQTLFIIAIGAYFTEYLYFAATIYMFSILFAFFTASAFIEFLLKNTIANGLIGTLRVVYVTVFAVVIFVSRIMAQNDVNSIFHIDASALPETLIFSSVLNFFHWFSWPLLVLSLCAGIIVYFKKKYDDILSTVISILPIIILIGLGLFRFGDEGRIQATYRFAHASDFSSTSDCQGISDDRYDVLFIGQEQRIVLVAPKIPSKPKLPFKTSSPEKSTYEELEKVRIPTKFPVVQCVPAVNYQCWEEEYNAALTPANYHRCVKF